MRRPRLSADLRERVLVRIGLSSAPDASLEGLRTVYSAWCASVPFDNSAKLASLLGGEAGRLPGIDAAEFFERFLAHGAGGTCWPSSNALFTLLSDLGFNARRIVCSMRDTGLASHGSVKVRFGSADWLVDSSMLTNSPLPLTDDVFVSNDPVFAAEVEKVGGTHLVWWDLPPNESYIPCRILVDGVTHEHYVERYEASRARSPFNERIYARRNFPGAMLVIQGNRRMLKTAGGVDSRDLSGEELVDCLRREAGLSGAMIDSLRTCGAITASLLPPRTAPPPPPAAAPPSKRIHAVAG